jgi:preprotein translocase SecE subunit
MRQKSTLVALFFLLAGIIISFVAHLATASLFGVLRVTNSPVLGDRFPLSAVVGIVVGLGAAFVCFSLPRTKTLAGEVIDELNKVNWPAADETRMNTAVVIITSVVAAVILGSFDIIFMQLSNWLAAQQIHI